MNWPNTRLHWRWHLFIGLAGTAFSLALWTLFPPLGELSGSKVYILIGSHLEMLGFYWALADLRYSRLGRETPLAVVAIAVFVLGAQLSFAGSLVS